jgi:hypothetical protein
MQQFRCVVYGSSNASDPTVVPNHGNKPLLLLADAACRGFNFNGGEHSKPLAHHVWCDRDAMEADQIGAAWIANTVADNPAISCLALTAVIPQQPRLTFGMRKDN